jgi:hypothetical protein
MADPAYLAQSRRWRVNEDFGVQKKSASKSKPEAALPCIAATAPTP